MKSIVLVRHAKVCYDAQTALDYKGMRAFLKMYDTAPIEVGEVSMDLRKILEDNACVMTSTLSRSIETAQALGLEQSTSHTMFNELEVIDLAIPFLRLKPMQWLTLFRVLMLLGVSKEGVSMKAHRKRASRVSAFLTQKVNQCSKVIVIGHGALNYLTGKSLVKQGWQKVGKVTHANMDYIEYRKV